MDQLQSVQRCAAARGPGRVYRAEMGQKDHKTQQLEIEQQRVLILALRSDSETMSSETGRRIQKLLHGIQKLLRRIQKLLLVFRNCQKLLWHIQKLLRRIQKLQVGFRVSLGIFRVSLGFNSFRVGLGFQGLFRS